MSSIFNPRIPLLSGAVGQGHTVFVISWVNPDETLAQKSFEDYIREGPLAALDAIKFATAERTVNAVGYCLGGTLLAATLAYNAAHGDDRIASATYFVTLVDFNDAGNMAVFIDEEQLAPLEKRMDERGYLEAHDMAASFNMLRANDLIWSFVVNNCLLGKGPIPFDLLFWNSELDAHARGHALVNHRVRFGCDCAVNSTSIAFALAKWGKAQCRRWRIARSHSRARADSSKPSGIWSDRSAHFQYEISTKMGQ